MYRAVRATVRAGLQLYCGRIRVDRATAPPANAVVLLACNHPNSFLDALVIATHLPYRIRFLARGDVFHDPRMARILRALYMIPIYRMRDGRAELKRTTVSLDQAHMQLRQGGSVLVFSEGTSLNEPGLHPLGKGTARIAWRAWQEELRAVQVLPVWLRYGGFHRPFLDITLATGKVMRAADHAPVAEAIFLQDFNRELKERLLTAGTTADRMALHKRPSRRAMRSLLFLPALAGLALHAPWYFAARAFTSWRVKDRVFLDSVLFVVLLLTYPLWLVLLVALAAAAGSGIGSLSLVVVAPLLLAALRSHRLQ